MAKHGTLGGWYAGCRDKCCWSPYNSYLKKRYELRKMKPDFVPLKDRQIDRTETVEHLKRLQREVEWSNGTLGLELGMSNKAVSNLIYGKDRGRIPRELAQRVLAIPVEPPRLRPDTNPRSRVDSTGTRRRLQAIMRMGYDARHMQRLSGLNESSLRRALEPDRRVTEANTVRKVIDLYNMVIYMPLPTGEKALRAQGCAKKWGFLAAGVWSDIDNPHCIPETDRLRKSKRS